MGTTKNQDQAGEEKLTAEQIQLRERISKKVNDTFCKRNEAGVCIDIPSVISARELSESKLIGWINSYKALLKYVSKDYRHIFEPKTTGNRSGTRYYVPLENVSKFLVMFEENKL